MLSTIWRSWEGNRNEEELKAENQYKHYKKPAVSEDVQQLLSNCYDYFHKSIPRKYGTTTETIKPLNH